MSRNYFCILLTCLLCLLPAFSLAQSLTKYEYWFDDNYSSCVSGNLSGTDALVNLSIGTDQLQSGFHKFSFRAKRSDGKYSAVTSVLFMKRPEVQNSQIEYWFDDKFDQRDVVSISNTEEKQAFELDLRSNAKYPMGFHKLNMRIALAGGGWSNVYSTAVLKLSAGKATKLEYWIDDDYANAHTISGELAADEKDYKFVTDLDLGDVTPGHHRLHCRPVSDSRIKAGAVTSVPVIVKSRYNIDPADVQMTKYSISVDDEDPVTVKFDYPDNDVTLDWEFDVHDLTPGTHTLKAKFWNSLGAGVGLEKQFTVTEPETPVINLTATEKDGIVLLRYDIPANQKNYYLQRRDANGAEHIIHRDDVFRGREVSDWWNDTPPAGSYTYYVQSVSYDDEGNEHLLNSNEVDISIEQSQDDLNNCGYITGYIIPGYGAQSYHDIIYSDGVETTTTNKFFERQMIPVGTTLTISVRGNSQEEFETATITIKSGENHVRLKDLKNVLEYESKPNNYSADLQFSSDLEWVGNNYQFSVTNATRNTWSGYVRLRIISKDKALKEKLLEEEKGADGESTDPSVEEEYDEITPGLRAEDNYVYVYSEEIKNLQSGMTTIVSLSLDDVFAPDKNDWYYIYFESVGKWNLDPKGSEKVKLISIDRDYSVTQNPMLRQVNKKDLKLAKEKVLLQDAEYAANIILACCSKLDQLNGIIGNLGDIGWVKMSKVYKEKYPLDLNKLNQYIGEAIETESAEEFMEDMVMQNFLFYVFGYNSLDLANKFREDVANEIFKYSKGVSDYLGGAMKCLKFIRGYRTWERMNDYDKFFYCADAIIDAASRYNSTLGSVLNTYSKVSKSFIQKALEIDAAYYENYEVSMLKHNALSENNNLKNHYNNNIDFKIMVRPNNVLDFLGYGYFDFEKNGTHPIRDVVLRVHNSPTHDGEATILFSLVPVSDGVMLKQTSIIDENNMEDAKPVDRMCLDIRWKNGRITKVPLRADIDGVELGKNPHDNRVRQYTVYLRSATTTFDNMADEIEVKE